MFSIFPKISFSNQPFCVCFIDEDSRSYLDHLFWSLATIGSYVGLYSFVYGLCLSVIDKFKRLKKKIGCGGVAAIVIAITVTVGLLLFFLLW